MGGRMTGAGALWGGAAGAAKPGPVDDIGWARAARGGASAAKLQTNERDVLGVIKHLGGTAVTNIV